MEGGPEVSRGPEAGPTLAVNLIRSSPPVPHGLGVPGPTCMLRPSSSAETAEELHSRRQDNDHNAGNRPLTKALAKRQTGRIRFCPWAPR